ncbi:MAG: polysaccharide pyruvyl transferase family protein [Clostridiales bacterium]
MTKVCISGYYGFDNLGDEAILLSMIHLLKKEFADIEITVLSDKPEKTAATYGVEAYDRWKWWQIHKAIMGSDIFISGGGGLLQDVTGKKSLLYYTHIMKMAKHRKRPVFIFSQGIGPIDSTWGQKHAVKALRKAAKVTVRDNESAKLLHNWGLRKGRIRITADPVLTMADLQRQWDVQRFVDILADLRAKDQANNEETEIEICLVDEKTLHNIMAENAGKAEAKAAKDLHYKTMNADALLPPEEKTEAESPKVDILVSESSVIGDEVATTDEIGVPILAENPEQCDAEANIEEVKEEVKEVEGYGIMGLHPSLWKKDDEKLAIFSVRSWENLPKEDIARVADMTVQAGYNVVFLPFQYPNDVAISAEVIGLMQEKADIFDAKTPLSPQEILTVMDEADFVFGMRLHALVFAAITKTPFASLSYNPKVKSFVEQLGLTATGDLDEYLGDIFVNEFENVLNSVDKVESTIIENIDELTEKAESVMEPLHILLDRINRRKERGNAPYKKKSETEDAQKAEAEAEDVKKAEAADSVENKDESTDTVSSKITDETREKSENENEILSEKSDETPSENKD